MAPVFGAQYGGLDVDIMSTPTLLLLRFWRCRASSRWLIQWWVCCQGVVGMVGAPGGHVVCGGGAMSAV